MDVKRQYCNNAECDKLKIADKKKQHTNREVSNKALKKQTTTSVGRVCLIKAPHIHSIIVLILNCTVAK
jgi:hypothetical protein